MKFKIWISSLKSRTQLFDFDDKQYDGVMKKYKVVTRPISIIPFKPISPKLSRYLTKPLNKNTNPDEKYENFRDWLYVTFITVSLRRVGLIGATAVFRSGFGGDLATISPQLRKQLKVGFSAFSHSECVYKSHTNWDSLLRRDEVKRFRELGLHGFVRVCVTVWLCEREGESRCV